MRKHPPGCNLGTRRSDPRCEPAVGFEPFVGGVLAGLCSAKARADAPPAETSQGAGVQGGPGGPGFGLKLFIFPQQLIMIIQVSNQLIGL